MLSNALLHRCLPSSARRRAVTAVGLSLPSAWSLAGCQPTQTSLRVGLHTWPGYELFTLVRSIGYLE